jgi:hypothetical protein
MAHTATPSSCPERLHSGRSSLHTRDPRNHERNFGNTRMEKVMDPSDLKLYRFFIMVTSFIGLFYSSNIFSIK